MNARTIPRVVHLEAESILQLRKEVFRLSQEVDRLATQLAYLLQPARSNWIRHSSPEFERGDTPATLRLVIPPEAIIVRVTIDQFQYVRCYRGDGHMIARFCGPFALIGKQVLARAKGLHWQQVMVPAPSPLTPAVGQLE